MRVAYWLGCSLRALKITDAIPNRGKQTIHKTQFVAILALAIGMISLGQEMVDSVVRIMWLSVKDAFLPIFLDHNTSWALPAINLVRWTFIASAVLIEIPWI